jgi:hypothetical protein
MKIVRTAKSIVTRSIKRSLTIVLVKVILATGLVSLITSYAFGQEGDPHIYVIEKAITKDLPKYSNLSDYSLKTDWSNDIPSKVNIEYSINFENQTLRKKVNGNLILQAKFTSLNPDRTFGYEFAITFENENYEKVYLFLNEEAIIFSDVLQSNTNEHYPFFLEIIDGFTSSNVLAYTTFSY